MFLLKKKRKQPKIAIFLLLLTLSQYGTVYAVSKIVFPEIEESDFKRHIQFQNSVNDKNIYLYNSFGIIGKELEKSKFILSKKPVLNVLPFVTTPIYPDIKNNIREEFFDYTIWGHLGVFFNKNIETIEFEREIESILKELERVNKRYYQILSESSRTPLNTDKIITIYRKNFFTQGNNSSTQESDQPQVSLLHGADNTTRNKTSLGENLIIPQNRPVRNGRLKANIIRSKKNTITYNNYSDPQRNIYTHENKSIELKDFESTNNSLLAKLIRAIMNLPNYVTENKIEAAIIAFFLLIMLKIAEAVFFKR